MCESYMRRLYIISLGILGLILLLTIVGWWFLIAPVPDSYDDTQDIPLDDMSDIHYVDEQGNWMDDDFTVEYNITVDNAEISNLLDTRPIEGLVWKTRTKYDGDKHIRKTRAPATQGLNEVGDTSLDITYIVKKLPDEDYYLKVEYVKLYEMTETGVEHIPFDHNDRLSIGDDDLGRMVHNIEDGGYYQIDQVSEDDSIFQRYVTNVGGNHAWIIDKFTHIEQVDNSEYKVLEEPRLATHPPIESQFTGGSVFRTLDSIIGDEENDLIWSVTESEHNMIKTDNINGHETITDVNIDLTSKWVPTRSYPLIGTIKAPPSSYFTADVEYTVNFDRDATYTYEDPEWMDDLREQYEDTVSEELSG